MKTCFYLLLLIAIAGSTFETAAREKPSNGSGGKAGREESDDDQAAGDYFKRGTKLPPGVQAERDIAYGKDHPKQNLDIYHIDSTEKRPTIVVVHGGGWKRGDKGVFGWYAEFLASQGYVAASINYRLSGDAKYPAQIEDCQAAVRFLRENAAKYGINPEKFGAIGHSAGGHLVSLMGTREGKDARVQAVVSCAGRHNFLGWEGGKAEVLNELLGGSKEEKPDLWKDASPVTHLTPDDPPYLLLCGTRDNTVPPSQSENFLKALQEKQVPAELIQVQDGRHGLSGGSSPTFEELDKKVLDFFAKHLK